MRNNPLTSRPWLFPALAFFACFSLYGQTLFFDFVWDDHIEVLGNHAFHDWKNFGSFFTTPYWTLMTGGFAPYHRPMIPIMICLVSTFFGKNPFGYHLLNLLLFSFTGVFFLMTLRQLRLSSKVILMATAIFAAHPVHAEAVSWGSARPVLLSGLCFIACFYFLNRAAETGSAKRGLAPLALTGPGPASSFRFAAFLIFSIGLLSYHSVLTLIPFLFLQTLITFKEGKKILLTKFWELTGLSLLGLGFIAYCLFLFHRAGETDLRPFYSPATANILYTGHAWDWLLTPINTLTRYSEVLLFPMNLIPDAGFKSSELSASALGSFFLICVISFKLFQIKNVRSILLLSLAWMFCGILTVGNFLPQGGLFADRYTYISSMGFALWAGLGLEAFEHWLKTKTPNASRIFYAFLGILLFFLCLKTITYSRLWKNEFTFWLETSILSPERARPHDKLGILLEKTGHLEEAVKEYKKVLDLDPNHFVMTYQRLAKLHRQLNQTEEAEIYQKKYNEMIQEAVNNKIPSTETKLLHVSN